MKSGNPWFSINNTDRTVDCDGNCEFGAGVKVSREVDDETTPIMWLNSTSNDNATFIRFGNETLEGNDNNQYPLGNPIKKDGSGGINYASVSDYRLKTNIQAVTDAVSESKSPIKSS